MNRMFYNTSEFNQELQNWNISNVTDMFEMFRGAKKFNQSLSLWVINSNVKIEGMFLETPYWSSPPPLIMTNNLLEKLSTPAVTSLLPQGALSGTTLLSIPDAVETGFKIGQTIIIGEGMFEEERRIVGFGSIILDQPLQFSHPSGSRVRVKDPANVKYDTIGFAKMQIQNMKTSDNNYQEYKIQMHSDLTSVIKSYLYNNFEEPKWFYLDWINADQNNFNLRRNIFVKELIFVINENVYTCLLYTSPSPRDQRGSRMPSSA